MKKHNNNPWAAQAGYLLAAYYETLAATYDPLKDTTQRFARLEAKKILEGIVKDSTTKTEGWVNSYNLLQQINKTEISFEVEKVNVPGQPFRALVKYKAATAVNFKLIKATEELKNRLRQGQDDKYWSLLTAAPSVRNWNQPLPATNDLQQHSVEVKIDALPVGEYILLATSGSLKK